MSKTIFKSSLTLDFPVKTHCIFLKTEKKIDRKQLILYCIFKIKEFLVFYGTMNTSVSYKMLLWRRRWQI